LNLLGLRQGPKTGEISGYFQTNAKIGQGRGSNPDDPMPGWINAEVIFAQALIWTTGAGSVQNTNIRRKRNYDETV
jgi:hypothetical protein